MEMTKIYDTSKGLFTIIDCEAEIINNHSECCHVIRIMEKDDVKLENILDTFIKLYGIIDWETFDCNFYSSLPHIFFNYSVGFDNINQISDYLYYKATKYQYFFKYLTDNKLYEDLYKTLLDLCVEIDTQILR